MKDKELILRDIVETYINSNFEFMISAINCTKKEFEGRRLSQDYLQGYDDGVEDFKDFLLKANIDIFKEKLNSMTVKEYTSELCGNTFYISECPACGEILNANKRQNHCHNCGQKLEWEE